MKHLLTLIVMVWIFEPILAQNDPAVRYRQCVECSNQGLDPVNSGTVFTYNVPQDYLAILVADDYGPRQLSATDRYDWHGGIDYNSGEGNNDMGDLILALQGGTLSGNLGTGYKRLLVQQAGLNYQYGYGHFFY